MPERYWLTFATRHRHGPPTQEPVYYQREGDRWRLYFGKAGRRRSAGTDSDGMVRWQVDLAKSEGRFVRHEPDQGRLFNPLVRGYSRQAIAANVSREMHAGRDQDQAVAIALNTARRAFRRRFPRRQLPATLRRNPTMATSLNPRRRRMSDQTRRVLALLERMPTWQIADLRRRMQAGQLSRAQRAAMLAYDRGETARESNPSERPHTGSVTYHEGAGYNAACRCGWGRWADTRPEAEALLIEHVSRNNRRNPGKAARAARAGRRAGYRADAREETEYIRMVRALPPDPSRLGRLEQSYELDKRLGRLQRRGVRETTIGRVAYRLNPRRRRRNPDRGDWLDLLVPLAVVFLLIRGGRVQVAS